MRDGKHLFNSEEATRIFWDRTLFYFKEHGFVPWVITLMVDHYHFPGYLKKGDELGEMMRKIHGSVAWMVNKANGEKHVPFWKGKGHRDYFDGCIRDVLQARRAYRYTLTQAMRAGIVTDWKQCERYVIRIFPSASG